MAVSFDYNRTRLPTKDFLFRKDPNMSEQTNKKACPICGAELSEDALFCSVCGAKQTAESERLQAVVPEAEASANAEKQAEDNKITSNEAKASETDNVDAVKKEEAVKYGFTSFSNDIKAVKVRTNLSEHISRFLSQRLVSAISVLLIAVTMFALWFAPFAHSKAEMRDGTVYNVDYSCAETVEFSVRSFFFLNNSELRDTKLYAEIENEISDEAAFEKGFALTLMKRNTPLRVTIILTALISIGYLILCIILLALSVIDLVVTIIAIKKGKRTSRGRSAAFLCAVCCMLPVLVFSFLLMGQYGMGNALSHYSNGGVGLSAGGIATLLVAIFGGGLVCLQKALNLKKPSKRFINKNKVKNIVCLCITLLVVISAFLPCLGIDIYSERTGNYETTVYVAPSDLYEVGNQELSQYRSTSKATTYSLVKGVVKDVVNGRVDETELSDDLFYRIAFGYARLDLRILYGFINAITMILLLFAGLLVYLFLSNIFFNSSNRGAILTFKILTSVWTFFELALILLLNTIISSAIGGELSAIIGIALGIGPVIMLVCMAVLLILPSDPKEYKYVDRDYDNADVSYSPYVVDEK